MVKLRTKIPNRTDEPEHNSEEDSKFESLKSENEALKQNYAMLLSDHENLKKELEETKIDLSNAKQVSDVKAFELKMSSDTVETLRCEVQKLGDELCDTKIELTEHYELVKVKTKEIYKAREDREKVAEDSTVLKGVINNFKKETTKGKNDLAHATKMIKAKDKEIHNLNIKIMNQQDTIKNLRDKGKDLKEEKLKLEREANKLKKKVDKKEVVKNDENHENNETEEKIKPPSILTSSSTFPLLPALDDNSNETDENFSHFPSVTTQNHFFVLNKP